MANATIDHDEIRKWAEAKGGKPAAVERTHGGGDVGIIRIMFPESEQSDHGSLVEISWDEFFKQFEDSNLALLYDEKSLFSKIVGRDTLERREHGEHASRHHPGPGPRSGGEQDAGGASHRGEGSDDLKSREYTDAEGNVYHHTRTYMEGHGKG